MIATKLQMQETPVLLMRLVLKKLKLVSEQVIKESESELDRVIENDIQVI